MIGAYLSVSIVNFAVIGYPFNCLDGQLNCQAFTHCIIDRTTKLSTIQSVIVAWHTPPTALGWLLAGNKASDGFTRAIKIQVTLCTVYMECGCIDFKCIQ